MLDSDAANVGQPLSSQRHKIRFRKHKQTFQVYRLKEEQIQTLLNFMMFHFFNITLICAVYPPSILLKTCKRSKIYAIPHLSSGWHQWVVGWIDSLKPDFWKQTRLETYSEVQTVLETIMNPLIYTQSRHLPTSGASTPDRVAHTDINNQFYNLLVVCLRHARQSSQKPDDFLATEPQSQWNYCMFLGCGVVR